MTAKVAEKEYSIGQHVKVRKLEGHYEIHDSWLVGGGKNKRRRYKLNPVRESGALLTSTESYADGMTLVPAPKPLELAPDPAPATVAQEPEAPAGHTEPAPVAAQPVADAIRSPERTFTPGQAFGLDEGAFGGELDEYSPGARAEEPSTLQNPYRLLRFSPSASMPYSRLKNIRYSGRFKGLENHTSNQLAQLEDGTPVGVIVTSEANGNGVWVITTEAADENRIAHLEAFYSEETGVDWKAIEHAVLLAMRLVPIRTEDLEILLLQLG